MTIAFSEQSLAENRPELLRHCYRMLGSFADAEEVVQDALASAWKARESYAGVVPIRHWLFRIATNACLNARRSRRGFHRALPAASGNEPVGAPLDLDAWITPAPDHALFGPSPSLDPARMLEERERVALAFVELLQTLPPRQRAVLLLKDVVGHSVEEIAETLDMSAAAVSSALHRARAALPSSSVERRPEPSEEVLRAYMRCWETRDLDGLLALLRDDAVLAMPPWEIWFRGTRSIREFLTTPGFQAFWSSGLRLVATRANGALAVLFHRDGGTKLHSMQLLRFDGERFSEMYTLVGPGLIRGFEEK